ncbi:MAG: FtsH protease activity modulator HflK [Candidatus Dasytiphilus stammeri]
MNLYQSSGKSIKKTRDPWENKNTFDENGSSKFQKFIYLIRGNHNKNNPVLNFNLFLIIMIITLIILLSTGFYTIKESDRAVITRFGKFSHIVMPGLNWKLTFIDRVYPINVEAIREIVATGRILTSDENIVKVRINVQYQITNPINYLFSVTNPDDSLRQATESALRGVIGKLSMDTLLTEGRTIICRKIKHELEQIIDPYHMGITLVDINLQGSSLLPEEVESAFNDAMVARENEQQYIREAEAYANAVKKQASGRAQRIIENAQAYKTRTILEAQGEVTEFAKVLLEYKRASDFTKERLYIQTMEYMLSHVHKILVDSNTHNILFIPLNFKNFSPREKIKNSRSNKIITTNMNSDVMSNKKSNNISTNYKKPDDILNKRKANAIRTNQE